MTIYPVGATVTFVDHGLVVDGKPSVATGTVNGAPIDGRLAPGADPVVAVPVWTECDNGREATTIFVAEGNVLSVEVPA